MVGKKHAVIENVVMGGFFFSEIIFLKFNLQLRHYS